MKRRHFIVGTLALGGLAALGGAAYAYRSPDDFIPGVLHALVGDYEMDPEQERRFVESFIEAYGETKLIALTGLYRLRAASGLGTAFVDQEIERFERQLVTDFMTTTDYLRQPREGNPPVIYLGRFPCRNPYARFT